MWLRRFACLKQDCVRDLVCQAKHGMNSKEETMEENNESKKPYVGPTLEKCEKLVEITEGAAPHISGVKPPPD